MATPNQKWPFVAKRNKPKQVLYYLPGEVCDLIGKEWFSKENDLPRSDAELLGMYLIARSRGTNFLLDVPPDTHGVLPAMYVTALQRLSHNLDKLGMRK